MVRTIGAWCERTKALVRSVSSGCVILERGAIHTEQRHKLGRGCAAVVAVDRCKRRLRVLLEPGRNCHRDLQSFKYSRSTERDIIIVPIEIQAVRIEELLTGHSRCPSGTRHI